MKHRSCCFRVSVRRYLTQYSFERPNFSCRPSVSSRRSGRRTRLVPRIPIRHHHLLGIHHLLRRPPVASTAPRLHLLQTRLHKIVPISQTTRCWPIKRHKPPVRGRQYPNHYQVSTVSSTRLRMMTLQNYKWTAAMEQTQGQILRPLPLRWFVLPRVSTR